MINIDSKDIKEMWERNPWQFSLMVTGIAASLSRIVVSLLVSMRGVH